MGRKVKIHLGDKVAYRVNFLRSTGMMHSDLARARGTVESIIPFGGNGRFLAQILWDTPEIPTKVLDQNLARVGSVAFTSEDA